MPDDRPGRTAALVVAVVALVALTSGPLYRVRTWWGYEDPLARDGAVVAVHAVLGAVAVAWLASAGRWRLLDRAALAWAAALAGWLLTTTLWSLDRAETARQSLQIASSLAVGAAAVVALGWRRFRVALWVALHVGLGWSTIAIATDRPGTIDRNGEWAGVFFNRNSLALYAALGVLVSAFVAADALARRRGRRTWLAVAAAAGAALVDIRLIAGSDALTPLLALVTALAAAALALVGRGGVNRGASPSRLAGWAGVVALTAATAAWVSRDVWLDRLGREGDLSGRDDLWSVALDWAWRRPFTGFGYLAAWTDQDFLDDVLATRGRLLGSAHNSFVEVLLGAGVVGLFALVGLVVVLYRHAAVQALVGALPGCLFPLAVLVFVVVENLTETLLVGNQLAVALLGALVAVRPRVPAATRRAVATRR